MAWSSRPDASHGKTTNQLLRVSARGPITAIVLSDDLTGTDTHYWQGRTRPCTYPACEACNKGNLPRWHGYLSVLGTKSGEIAILELTPSAVPPIEAWLESHASLRGATITARRANGKPNGKLIISIADNSTPGLTLPAACEVQSQLENMWLQRADQSERPTTTQRIVTDPKSIGEILANHRNGQAEPLAPR